MERIDAAGTSPPSRTAMMTALARAMHGFHHGERALLTDWLAWPLVGAEADAMVAAQRPVMGSDEVPFLAWYAARARLTEDWLDASGADQYVVLGAGLDTFAWRRPGDVRVVEVDHPATQRWKAERLETLGVPTPPELVRAPVDFESDDLRAALEGAGVGRGDRVFVSWLGVIPYLTRDAIVTTLRALPPCSLAVGYLPHPDEWDEDARRLGTHMQAVVEALGEPFVTLTSPSEVAALLAEGGFTVREDVGAHDIEPRYGIRALNYERMVLAVKEDHGS